MKGDKREAEGGKGKKKCRRMKEEARTKGRDETEVEKKMTKERREMYQKG